MDNQNNIQDELRSLNSSLPVNNSQPLFSVPEGYFDGLAGQILSKAKGQHSSVAEELQALSPLLAGISKKPLYTVPEGYFNDNAEQLPFLLSNKEGSPVLEAVGKTLPYTIPDGYFDQVPQKIMATLVRPKAKVVPFLSRTWAKAAIAAVIGGIVFFGGARLLSDRAETIPATAQRSAADTTQNPVARNGTGLSQAIKNMSTEELDEFMKTIPLNTVKMQRATLAPKEKQDVKDLLKDVPEKDIDAFLEGIPTADDNLLVID